MLKPALPSVFLVLFTIQWFCVYPTQSTSTRRAAATFNDPDFNLQQWAFEMINLYPVWEKGLFGKGIRIRVNDGGVDPNHAEFQGRFDIDASCDKYEPYFYREDFEFGQHGTVVASLIGASGNNSQCAMGVAPEVTISSCVVIEAPSLDRTFGDGSYPAFKLDTFDISQNSFGRTPCYPTFDYNFSGTFADIMECPFLYRDNEDYIFEGEVYNLTHPCDVCEFPTSNPDEVCSFAIYEHCDAYFEKEQDECLTILDEYITRGECSFWQDYDRVSEAIEKGATEGRGGKGVIYVYASGNNFAYGDNTNFQQQGRFIIFVGAVGKNGQHTLYSTPGASVFLTAPAGDYEDADTLIAAYAGGGCDETGVGTSFSSPLVSGVIALMLQVNPDLTWRDVQGILAKTSRPVNHTIFDDTSQTTNGAGLTHSNLYGFGLVDAMAAVTAAENWTSYGEEQLITAKVTDLNLEIGDDPSVPVMSETFVESSGPRVIVENVEVDIYLEHLSRGHLQITLTSPDGTVSELAPGSLPENGQDDRPWDFRTVRSWGELADGVWKLSIVDNTEGDVSTCADMADWKVLEIPFGIASPVGCEYYEVRGALQDGANVDKVNSLIDQDILNGCCSCGGGQQVNGACESSAGFNATCAEVESEGICVNGSPTGAAEFLLRKDPRGITMREACCVGGGGTIYNDASTFQDILLGWELRIYGHEGSPAPMAPSIVPQVSPTMGPSMATQRPTNTEQPITIQPTSTVPAPRPPSSDDVATSTAFRQSLSHYHWVCIISGMAALFLLHN
ncbi:unnamed protein product [Cylindrotheca closterium]|uniref:subtilisin n=1 Tax=Cylindrotheca closterium TaxID=2856 RepID=A0AAD2FHK6_9STRA|nr:unnamed protein product [Cylindrotheca closterium]